MIQSQESHKRLFSTVFWACAIGGTMMLGSANAISSEIPAEYRYKNQDVTLPPEAMAFVSAKEQQAETLARQENLELEPAIKNYFTVVKAGHLGKSQQLFEDLSDQARSTNANAQLKGPIQQVLLDVTCAVEAFGANDPDLVMATAREMTNSMPSGCIYFGGTDPGRGLPTLLCPAPGDPFFVLSQNALADGRYLDLLRVEYGSRIQFPTTNEVQKCVDDYTADVQLRAKQGKLRPGEDVHMVDGKPKAEGQVAIMGINALIAKGIFDKNPDRDFYYEESFPLDWMYPNLMPHGLLMKLNRQPLNEMPAEAIQKDEDFWSQELAGKIGGALTIDTPLSNVCAFAVKVFAQNDLSGFQGDSKFIASEYPKAYSKWRTSIAGVYAWRLSPQCPPEYRPKNDAQRKQLMQAADFASRQAFVLCPYSPEAIYRYVNFLLQLGRFDDAILIAKTGLACSPKSGSFSNGEQLKNLIGQLENYKNQSSARSASVDNVSRMEKEFSSNPTNFTVGVNLAHAYLSLNQTNRAFGLLDQIVANQNVNASVLGNVAQTFSQLGNLGKLETTLTRMTEVTPGAPEIWYDLAGLRSVLGEKTGAIDALKRCLALNAKRLQSNPSARDLAAQAMKDPHFNSLKNDPEFQGALSQTSH
jgi:tetratricopeptide (TPR) repeat protein